MNPLSLDNIENTTTSIMSYIAKGEYHFHFIGKFTYKAKTLCGMRTRLIGRTLGATSLQADSFLLYKKLHL